jgi:hypothetical protein
MDEQKIQNAYIYTYNESEEFKIESKTIKITPLWKEALLMTNQPMTK